MATKSPDSRLREVTGSNTQTVVKRIIATYRKATPSIIESGTDWYSEGERLVNSLSRSTGYSRETVAAVIAHLSPQTTWKRNVTGAKTLLTKGYAPHCIGANVKRAKEAMASSDPISTLNGRKTRRFALNLLGDRNAVTVDVWATRIALGNRIAKPENLLKRVGVYSAIERAYQIAANRIGIDPRAIQAITWITIRNGRSN